MINFRMFTMYVAFAVAAAAAAPSYAQVSPNLDLIKFEDNALNECVHAYAKEQGYATVADVKEIPCFGRAVRSIKGLELFTEALVIDLSRNDIHSWSPLYGLQTRLGYIDIHDNPISCAEMTTLAQKLRRAYRIGFDPALCDGTPGQPAPQEPTKPQPAPQDPTTPHPAPAPGPSYEEVSGTITATCGPCHQNGRHKAGVSLNSREELSRYAGEVLSSIESGYMPPRDSAWQNSADGKAVIAYLKTLVGSDPTQPRRHPRHGGDDDEDEHEGHGRHGEHDD